MWFFATESEGTQWHQSSFNFSVPVASELPSKICFSVSFSIPSKTFLKKIKGLFLSFAMILIAGQWLFPSPSSSACQWWLNVSVMHYAISLLFRVEYSAAAIWLKKKKIIEKLRRKFFSCLQSLGVLWKIYCYLDATDCVWLEGQPL